MSSKLKLISFSSFLSKQVIMNSKMAKVSKFAWCIKEYRVSVWLLFSPLLSNLYLCSWNNWGSERLRDLSMVDAFNSNTKLQTWVFLLVSTVILLHGFWNGKTIIGDFYDSLCISGSAQQVDICLCALDGACVCIYEFVCGVCVYIFYIRLLFKKCVSSYGLVKKKSWIWSTNNQEQKILPEPFQLE